MNKNTIYYLLFLCLVSSTKLLNAQDGSLDISFDGDGKIFYGDSLYQIADDIGIYNNGKILGVYSSNNFINLVRFQSDGTLDNSFDSDGFYSIYFDPNIFGAYICERLKLKILNDDKILLAGYTTSNSLNDSIIIIRLNNDGSFDTTFGVDGISSFDLNNYDFPNSYFCYPISFEIQNDGKIVVFDRIQNNLLSNEGFIIIRLNNDGTLDTSFNNNGYLIKNEYYYISDYGQGLCLQNDGKIVVNGSDYYFTTLFRYNLNGSVDSTFNQDGEVRIQIPNSSGGVSTSIDIDNIGNFVIVGSNDYIDSIFVARLDSNGFLDISFDYDGISFFGYTGYNIFWDYKSIAIQNDNKILVSGMAENYPSTAYEDIFILRINTNGSFDQSFDNDGIVITSGNSCEQNVNSISLQSDGKILIAGSACSKMFLARYNNSNSTSVDFVKNESILFYPNPFFDEIKFEVVDNSEIKVKIHDILGRKYLEQSLNITSSINTSLLPAGTYLLSIRHENGYIQNEKIIKP